MAETECERLLLIPSPGADIELNAITLGYASSDRVRGTRSLHDDEGSY